MKQFNSSWLASAVPREFRPSFPHSFTSKHPPRGPPFVH